MSDVELLDDLEAGELSVEFEGEEPEAVLEWAIAAFGDRLAISTAFQEGDVALIDMAYRIDPSVKLFSIDTGRLPTETFELIETLRERYPGLALTLLSPDARQLQRLVDRHGPNLFYRSIEQRLLCCNVRKVQPLTRYLAGVDAWVTGLRRDQWAGAHRHPQGRDRPRPRRDREAEPARRVDGGRGLGLRARERRPRPPALRAGLHVDRLRAVHAPGRRGRAEASRALVVGVGRAEGVRDALRDRDRRLRARAARDPRRGGAC